MRVSCATAGPVADLPGHPGEIDWSLAMEIGL
jgi:hypothetical protein